VIFNLTETADGNVRPMQPRELYRTQQCATAVYRSELAARLTALGYESERGRSGQPEIHGYTREYLDASSPRRQQIEDYLAAADRQGAASAQIAAHQTRERKIDVSHDEMQRRHHEVAEQFGNQPAKVVEVAEHQYQRHEEQEHGRERADAARRAVTFARDRNLEREAVVEERALLRDALQRSLTEARLDDVKQEFERRVERGEFIAIEQERVTPDRSFTTPSMMELERETIEQMRAGQEQHTELVSEHTREAITREYDHLNEGQRAAVQEILSSRDQVTALEGTAGAGKTTALAAVRDAAEREGTRSKASRRPHVPRTSWPSPESSRTRCSTISHAESTTHRQRTRSGCMSSTSRASRARNRCTPFWNGSDPTTACSSSVMSVSTKRSKVADRTSSSRKQAFVPRIWTKSFGSAIRSSRRLLKSSRAATFNVPSNTSIARAVCMKLARASSA
jgi:hypothetical protein